VEEKDLKKVILENLNKIITLLSLSALFFGGLWLLIYSHFIAKELPISEGASFLYYIFAISIYLIISIVLPLALYLYDQIIEENIYYLDKKSFKEINIENMEGENKNNKIIQIIQRLLKRTLTFIFLLTYIIVNVVLFYSGGFFIFNQIGCEIPNWITFLITVVGFLIFQIFLICILRRSLEHFIIDKGKDALLFSIIYISILVIIIYAGFFFNAPFYLLKLGYFEANLTLDKEYTDKIEFKTSLEKCQKEEAEKSQKSNSTCKKQSQDTQNNNCCKLSEEKNKTQKLQDTQTFNFFIFLRTNSEYIVGCKDSDVRIRIPVDKVIAIEYKD
jgi:hypothetical protein